MSQETLTLLQNQFGIASQLAHYHLDTLTTEECLWRPTPHGLHVQRQPDGRWVADWPDREDYGMGAASIGWLTWHMGFWWSMVLDHSFGDATLEREAVLWPGSAEDVIAWISGLESQWIERIGNLSSADLTSTGQTRWPFQDRPFAEVVGWATVELTKNASEIGYARFLYGSRS
jgi:hypothetical protein